MWFSKGRNIWFGLVKYYSLPQFTYILCSQHLTNTNKPEFIQSLSSQDQSSCWRYAPLAHGRHRGCSPALGVSILCLPASQPLLGENVVHASEEFFGGVVWRPSSWIRGISHSQADRNEILLGITGLHKPLVGWVRHGPPTSKGDVWSRSTSRSHSP